MAKKRRSIASLYYGRKSIVTRNPGGRDPSTGKPWGKNVAAGYVDEEGEFHPIRASYDYSGSRAGDAPKKSKKKKKNPSGGGDGLVNLLIGGGVLFALYLWLQNNCASASPLSTSLCSTLFGTSSTSSSGVSTVEANCLASFQAAILSAAGGNQTLANSAIAALTAADLSAIQTSCAAGTVPAIPADAQAVITAGASSSNTSASSSSGGTGLAIPSGLTVTPVINNGLQGTVNVNGQSVVLAVIPANLGQSTGVVYNASGQDVTSQFTAAEIQQLVSAFTLAPQVSSSGVAGLSGLAGNRISMGILHGWV
jgi:hypothetical protein